MTLQQEAKELVERNKGDVDDIIKILNHLVLIYSILSTEHEKYKQVALDYNTLKLLLQIEKELYFLK